MFESVAERNSSNRSLPNIGLNTRERMTETFPGYKRRRLNLWTATRILIKNICLWAVKTEVP